ncbi:MAG: DUF4173 domain-containing protein [Candidatus Latescibacteria bacterium]|nr:DUF4173 domain-containing protein [Candidatus Latescibacterota bacterium]
MNERTTWGLRVLGAALIVGVLGDALLRVGPWGVNLLSWMVGLLVVMILLTRWRRIPLPGDGRWLLLPVIVFAAACAWHDSVPLKLLNLLALLVALSLATLRTHSGRLQIAGLIEYGLGLITTGCHALLGMVSLLFRDIHWKDVPRDGWSRHAMAVGRGLAIAFPLMLLFGGLFMAADAVFEGIINRTFQLDFEELFTHTFLIAFWTWIVGGFLRGLLLGHEMEGTGSGPPTALSLGFFEIALPTLRREDDPDHSSKLLSLGIVETGIVLGLLDVLFLAFVIIQVRYLFGGVALVEVTKGLTYATYARRGFFELVAVAALVLPLLLVVDWLQRKEKPEHELLFRVLAGAQVLMLFVIMASAAQRMRLYQSAYGLTQQRLYATAFMTWLAVVFLWFVITVLRGQRKRFAYGALMAGFLVLAGLHVLNPDDVIIRTNIAHADAGHAFDAKYTLLLSGDAVPALVAGLPSLSPPDRSVVASHLLKRWSPTKRPDWRTWDWGRAVARRVVRENEEVLREIAAGQTKP